MHAPILDSHGRTASYMRISVTDRCNLRCTYCAGEGMEFIPHPKILRYEEILDIIALAEGFGVEKVRFTGGEPFVRLGFADFMIAAANRFPNVDMCVTTNGTLIGEHIEHLAKSGVRRMNISLDTMNRKKYEQITGRDKFDIVRENIDRCLDAGMTVKVNSVAMRGVNDDELPEFLEYAASREIDFRFIEFMPVGTETGWKDDLVWTADDILTEAQQLADLRPSVNGPKHGHGPARMYDIVNGKGRLGLISSYSNHFCATCNRLRITSDGFLRTCLFSDKVYKLRPALRNEKLGLDFVERIIRSAMRSKPIGYDLLRKMSANHGHDVCHTRMASIGG
ncbi:GTP 3',8-cyclase MoaA [Pseudodesulfovibrio sp. JC047]|uniref:GTP 3',8-cyclase MoaA n=1 Tax=Pseudodesulfovibrio sp. JC047 TaxID=2683199 RepID=UPI0013D4B68F|nr:GTP 3',8-cyclase MoaA [Pseudodesulfovibrio sp. JC047]NDV18529.1 GTP 3',8-cyclase MoaA [Pseudodesulfovibrio sp. JC047]